MEELKYFDNVNVPFAVSAQVDHLIPKELVQNIFGIAFETASVLRKKGLDASYFQSVTVDSKDLGYEEGIKIFYIKMQQEQPDYVVEKIVPIITDKMFTGKLYLIESWNGKTEDVTIDDHNIALILKEEY